MLMSLAHRLYLQFIYVVDYPSRALVVSGAVAKSSSSITACYNTHRADSRLEIIR